jgi:DNA helicase-2/ATP-dependent DNA helicase PcrA
MDVFASLTPAQREAVAHIAGPLLILAGPGSGKTRVVTQRIANLLQHGIAPWQILALTFTNKAAAEMRERVHRLVGTHGVWMGTFHAFCARLLRQYGSFVGLHPNFSICDTEDSGKALRQALVESGVELTHTSLDALARAISDAKNAVMSPEEYVGRAGYGLGTLAEKVYPFYQRRLLESNAVDFDDLLLHVATLLRQNPELRASLDERFRYILVDEYQDTNLAQYAIVRALSNDFPNLAVTGDPDQSIYGWRGANLNNILEFEHDYPEVKVVRLEQNFRSTPNILRVADHLISYNVRRKAKRLYTDRPEGAPVRLVVYPTGLDEADQIARRIADDVRDGRRRPRDFAIFYRINALSRQFEHALRRWHVPYQIVNGQEFYQRREIKDVLAYLHLLNNPQHDVAFLRIVNVPTRGLGQTTIDRLTRHARQHHVPLLEAAREVAAVEAISKRAAKSVTEFVALFDRMSRRTGGSVRDIMDTVLAESDYRAWLSDSEEDQQRLANIEELLTAADEFDRQRADQDHRLETFLEQAALVADTDAWEGANDSVALMTLHAAKGLEFPVVYLVAVEHRLLPHEHSREDRKQLEEERRLFFVGMTRAQQELQISMAQYRAFRGARQSTVPSEFLLELPREELQYSEPSSCEHGSEWKPGGGHEAEPAQQPVWSDDEFVQEDPEAAGRARLKTAAEMLDDGDSASEFSPNAFRPGMPVFHPEYGSGTIVAASGTGRKRTVSVRFRNEDVPKSFLVAHSPLAPIQDD